MTNHIYLDHNATTPLLPEVADAVRDASVRYHANPGSQHQPGRQARRALEEARLQVGKLLGARTTGMNADRVIFTSGGTEAANLALFGLLGGLPGPSSPTSPASSLQRAAPTASSPTHFLTSTIEHPCILESAAQLPNCEVEQLPVDTNGVVDLDQVRRRLRPETRLVSVMLANNETGVLQPVAEIAALCAEQGIAMHSDAAQMIGKLPVDFTRLNLSAMSCAAHKFNGPLGIGALLVRHNLPLQPTLFGGHQQGGLRPGTETVALAIGMQTALECWHRTAIKNIQRIARLRDQFEQILTAELPTVEVLGSGAARLPNTSNLAFVGMNRQALLMALDQAGVACSSGSACASGSSELSPVLLAMGLKKEVIEGSIRFSLGVTTTTAEIEESCRRILSLCKRLR
ncbi:MAG: cysteine desulfurase [Planctomycetes bacterium]|nr:cysteine desulfurase [Planctomycetota bacterium]